MSFPLLVYWAWECESSGAHTDVSFLLLSEITMAIALICFKFNNFVFGGGWTAVQHTSPHRMSRTHTKCYAAASPQLIFMLLTIFKISDFNKEPTSSLKMI